MTTKQQQILDSALHLFSNEGYHATSTSKVAKQAKVSEGLIFRHFRNKEGLLKALLEAGKQRMNKHLAPILSQEDPITIIQSTIELPFALPTSDYAYFKLQFQMNLGLEFGNDDRSNLYKALVLAFKKSRYKNPEMETEFLLHHLNGLINSIVNYRLSDQEQTKAFLFRKYHFQ